MAVEAGITVLLVNSAINRSAACQLATLPRTGDMLWLNKGLFKVEQVVTSYAQGPNSSKAHQHSVAVFIDEVQVEADRTKYDLDGIDYRVSRNDDIGTLCDHK